MPKYRKRPVVIDAEQWHERGRGPVLAAYQALEPEGRCAHCAQSFSRHGQIETLEGFHIVCPGDWILTGVRGERYPCKPDIFASTYDPVEEHPSDAWLHGLISRALEARSFEGLAHANGAALGTISRLRAELRAIGERVESALAFKP